MNSSMVDATTTAAPERAFRAAGKGFVEAYDAPSFCRSPTILAPDARHCMFTVFNADLVSTDTSGLYCFRLDP